MASGSKRRPSPTATASARWRRGERSATSAIHASPSTAGARKKLPWTFAHRTAIGTTSHRRRACAARSVTSRSVSANSAMAISCGRRAIAGAATANAPSASHAASRTPVPWRRHSSKIEAAISPTRAARKSTSPVHPATR